MQPPRRLHAAATSRRSFAALRPLLCSWPSLPSGLHAPCALSRLATGRTRAALRRRRSAALRPGADRRITRKAAGGSWADTFMPPFARRALRPAVCGQRALAGAPSAIRQQAPLAHPPPSPPHAGEARAVAWEGRSRWPSTARSPMQGLAAWSAGPPHRTLSAGSLSLPAGELRGARAAHGQPVPPSRRGVPARPLPSVLTPSSSHSSRSPSHVNLCMPHAGCVWCVRIVCVLSVQLRCFPSRAL